MKNVEKICLVKLYRQVVCLCKKKPIILKDYVNIQLVTFYTYISLTLHLYSGIMLWSSR